jgi:DNA-binding HxlR family transcriptional regulator
MDWRDYGYVVASSYRLKVVRALSPHPKTPKQISTETQIDLTHISRVFRELSARGLVHCVNPQDVKGRVYSLTDKGKELASIVEKDDSLADGSVS